MRRNYQKHTNPNPFQRWLLGRFHASVVEMIEAAGGSRLDSPLLDVGCGEGFVVDFLHEQGFKAPIVGLDADRVALAMAKQLGGDVLAGSATGLPFADASFPTVLCLEVLEHLTRPDLALRELARVSSAYVIASVPNQPYFSAANFLRGKNLKNLGEDPEHVHHWTG
ncbi:MAG: class I SAM-dependent methyltransferase, partial [Chloroflexi bacterium]|nr:class I SAM-dependent methyltransferase [Chloroflexota bacterium]